MLLKLC